MSLRNYPDDLIVKTIKENDIAESNNVLKIIYRDFYPMISKFIITNSGNKTEAQDIFQETIVTFYEKAKSADFMLTCSLKTYLYSISRNLWLKRLSKIKRLEHSINDFEDFINVDGSSEETDDSKDTLMTLIDSLDEGCKQILIYYYYDKLKMNIIKDKMNLGSEQSAKNKKCKCMKHLMEIIRNNKNLNAALKEKYLV